MIGKLIEIRAPLAGVIYLKPSEDALHILISARI